MTDTQLNQLKFPIGPFVARENITASELNELIEIVSAAPEKYARIASGLSAQDLKNTYREGSWNVQQLIHHVADMQLLHFFRMKKALTDPEYKEVTLVNIDGWAHTPDSTMAPLADSLDMFDAITRRFVRLMKSLTAEQQDIAYYHPVRKSWLNQKNAIAMTAWHVQHHLEHIKIALENR